MRSATLERPLCAALAVVAVCLVATLAVCASETADSGWAVGKPSLSFQADQAAHPAFRIAVNNALQQSELPVLNAPEPPSEPVTAEAPTDPNPTADGWTSTKEPAAAEVDCSGEPSHETEVRFRRPRGESRPTVANPRHSTASASSTPVLPPASPLDLKIEPPFEADEPVDDSSEVDNVAPNERPAANPAPRDSKTVEITDDPKAKSSPTDNADDEPLTPLSRSMKGLRSKVRGVLKGYTKKPLNSRENDPWETMHGMLAYGLQSQIRQGGPQGELITAVGWLCYNQPCKGYTLLYVTPEGELRGKQGVGLQGHMGQFLAMLAQCQVSESYPIRVGKKEFTIRDLIEAEKKTCYPKSELTFKLIALMHYLDSDETWVNDQGLAWDIPKLIHEELAQPIRGAACGGTHRLSGLSLAARTRVRRGEPLDGEYARASEFVENYERYAFQLQNSDGSLSTEWFRGRGDDSDLDRRCKTTGHILEWLCYSLSDEELRATRTVKAVNYLATLLASNYDRDWEKGPRSHAIHALKLYDERVFQPYDGREEVANSPAKRSTSMRQSKSRTQQR